MEFASGSGGRSFRGVNQAGREFNADGVNRRAVLKDDDGRWRTRRVSEKCSYGNGIDAG
jgi:hypothetical protein